MLTDLGAPLLRWLDDELLPEAGRTLLGLWRYVHRWRVVLDV